ncbi:DedA family protein [Brachybacterium sp. DNPG3]
MIAWIQSLPIVPAVLFFYGVILMRAGGTYALGRGFRRLATGGQAAERADDGTTDASPGTADATDATEDRGLRTRIAAFLSSDRISRATDTVNRWGAPVVALSFLTVGFQTAVNAAAGLNAMPLRRYLPALAVGGLAWALIHATVGLAVALAWVKLFLFDPWVAGAVTVLAILAIVLLILRRRTRGRPDAASPASVASPARPAPETSRQSEPAAS